MIGGLNPSEDMKVSWDDDYSQYMENHKIQVPNHQSYIYISDHITSTSSLDPIFHHLRWAHPHILTNLVPSLLSLA